MKSRNLPLFFSCVILLSLFQGRIVNAAELQTGAVRETVSTEAAAEQFITLKIPLFSPHFADTVVAMVNEEPITLRDLESALLAMRETKDEQAGKNKQGYLGILERLVNSQLVIEEALNIGFDETEAFQTQMAEFKTKLLQRELIANQLKGLEADPVDVAEVYQQISREVKLDTLTFETGSEAQRFLNEVKDGGFYQLAQTYVNEGKVKEQTAGQYVKIKDLRLQIRQKAYGMKVGEISTIYRTEDGFLLFYLADTRFVEDPPVKQEAVKISLDTLRKQRAMEYSNTLADKYVVFDEELYASLDFDNDLNTLMNDKRVLATVQAEDPLIITVGDLAKNLEIKFFHGADKAKELKMVNSRKDSVISNMLFSHTSELEAHRLGLDQTEDFKRKVLAFERSSLFSAFMNKVILPDVKLTADEVRTYYDEHIEDYSSPEMLELNSLVFRNRQDAESALAKLQKGADYKWVSANASGFVPADTPGVLPFNQNLLSLTALPDDLRPDIAGVAKGNSLLYAPSEGGFFYVLLVEEIFPPEPQPYDQVKSEVAKVVFNMKSEQLLNEYTAQLKEAYETVIYLTAGTKDS